MRLLFYNIRYGAGIGRRFHFPVPYSGYLKPTNGHFEKIVQFIKGTAPDIVGLVEVDIGSFRAEWNNQAERIARELNHEAVYRQKYAQDSIARRVPLLSKQGNAVLSRQNPVKTRFHYLNHGVKRLVIEVELAELSIFLVHLSIKYRHRQYQLHDLHTLVSQCRKPVVVAGDFNALWGDRELNLFLAATGLISANAEGQYSWPSRMPRLQLDYIFHSPEIRTTGFDIPRIRLSDHAPLIWDFSLGPVADVLPGWKPRPDRPPQLQYA